MRSAIGAQSPATLGRIIGRVVLWTLIGVLLLRGLLSVLGRDEAPTAATRTAPAAAVPAWPDTEAEAFATDFATAYLSYSPKRPGHYAQSLVAFASPALAEELVPRFAQRDSRQVVQSATVVRTARVDATHARVTVATRLATEAGTVTRLLGVPVARDARGALGVYDLPSFATSTARAQVAPPETKPLEGVDEAAVDDVLTRFFTAYLSGKAADLAYLVPAGASIPALDDGLQLVSLDEVGQAGPATGDRRTVLATVRVRDVATRAVYGLRYRVGLVKRDRWYVGSIDVNRKAG